MATRYYLENKFLWEKSPDKILGKVRKFQVNTTNSLRVILKSLIGGAENAPPPVRIGLKWVTRNLAL